MKARQTVYVLTDDSPNLASDQESCDGFEEAKVERDDQHDPVNGYTVYLVLVIASLLNTTFIACNVDWNGVTMQDHTAAFAF